MGPCMGSGVYFKLYETLHKEGIYNMAQAPSLRPHPHGNKIGSKAEVQNIWAYKGHKKGQWESYIDKLKQSHVWI